MSKVLNITIGVLTLGGAAFVFDRYLYVPKVSIESMDHLKKTIKYTVGFNNPVYTYTHTNPQSLSGIRNGFSVDFKRVSDDIVDINLSKNFKIIKHIRTINFKTQRWE